MDGGIQPAEPRAYALLRGANPAEILERYLSDEKTSDIAATYGCTRQALGQFLLKTDPDGWKAAQVARAVANKEEADDDLNSLKARIDASKLIEDDSEYEREKEALRLQLSLAQARAKRAEWELERLLSRLYGQKQEVTVNHQAVIDAGLLDRASELLGKVRGRVIDMPVDRSVVENDSMGQSVDNAPDLR